MKLINPNGATPLDQNAINGLIPQHLTSQAELNAYEAANIAKALSWINARSLDILNISFIKELHKQMFDQTWKWAGTFRDTNPNLGVHWKLIQEQLKFLCDDIEYQISHETIILKK